MGKKETGRESAETMASSTILCGVQGRRLCLACWLSHYYIVYMMTLVFRLIFAYSFSDIVA